jgi:UDP-GlcNAc:undecaprenyl-phosphate/decaprenyl-phosphate GlcNAc-1-phosphate transferase
LDNSLWLPLKVLILSGLVSFFSTSLVRRFFEKKDWVENRKEKEKKTGNVTASRSVPRGGGIPIFLAILVTLFFLPLDKHLGGILLGGLLSLTVGVWDDIVDISPLPRLLSNFLAAGIVVGSGIGIAVLSNPLGGTINLAQPQIAFELLGETRTIWILADLLAVAWIVWCMNSVGWATGVEGQLPGFAAISAVVIGLLALRFSQDITQWPVIILSFGLAGAYLGFLPHNFYPQKIMPGYSGKSLAGYFLAVLAILSGAKLATVILVLGIPMIDGIWAIIRRLYYKKALWKGDAGHFHHHLLRAGWGRRRISVFYWLVSLGLGILALSLNSQQKPWAFLLVGIGFGALIWSLKRKNGK